MEPMTTTPSSHGGSSDVDSPMRNGSTPTSRPATAPQAPTRESDNSSNPQRPSAIPSTAEKSTPQRKPGYAPIATHISSMDSSGSTISPISTATGAHTTAQVRPIKTAPPMRPSHIFITTFLCTSGFLFLSVTAVDRRSSTVRVNSATSPKTPARPTS